MVERDKNKGKGSMEIIDLTFRYLEIVYLKKMKG